MDTHVHASNFSTHKEQKKVIEENKQEAESKRGKCHHVKIDNGENKTENVKLNLIFTMKL